MKHPGPYSALADAAHDKRVQEELHAELIAVLKYCHAAQAQMRARPPLSGSRARIWAHLVDVIDLAEQAVRRGGQEP